MILTHLPEAITPELVTACDSRGLGRGLAFLDIRPAPAAEPNRCAFNALRYVENHGGEVVYGWKLLHWPGVLVQFLGHAVIRDEDGLTCITPDSKGDERVLFIADSGIAFDKGDPSARLPSAMHPLISDPEVSQFIDIQQQILEIKLRYPRSSGVIRVVGQDPAQLQSLQARERRLIGLLLLKTHSLNRPCPCSSGKAFAHCCQPGMKREILGQ